MRKLVRVMSRKRSSEEWTGLFSEEFIDKFLVGKVFHLLLIRSHKPNCTVFCSICYAKCIKIASKSLLKAYVFVPLLFVPIQLDILKHCFAAKNLSINFSYQSKMEDTDNNNNSDNQSELLKSDQSRFVDYSFGNVQCINLQVSGSLCTSVATASPLDGATLTIPSAVSHVLLQSASDYTQLSLKFPTNVITGQTLTITCTRNCPNVNFVNATFGTTTPTGLVKDRPIRLIYNGSMWFNV